MLVRIAALCWLAAAALTPAAAQTADRVALVMGNGRYAHASALPNPGNDAREVAKALRDIGFDVQEGRDLDRSSMERALRDFLRKAGSARIALLFFAGHGMQIDGRNYLIPIDAKLEAASDLNFETIDLDKILESFNDPQRAYIVILDACRDNPLARTFASRLGPTRSAAVGTGLAAYSTLGTGTLIAFATAPGKVSLDGQGSNSPFTVGLVKHLRTPGLEVRQLLTRVRLEVTTATNSRQVPWDNSSLLGDIYLAGRPDPGQAATPAPKVEPPRLEPRRETALTPPPEPKPTRRIVFKGYNGRTYVEGDLVGDANGNWIETNTQNGALKLHFTTRSDNKTELLLYDQSRDMYLRLNFVEKQMYWRQTARGPWNRLYRITSVN